MTTPLGASIQYARWCDTPGEAQLAELRRGGSGILGAEEPPSIRNATSVAVDLIRTAIVEGRIGPGERLKEEEIARDLGLSRTPVREALLLLQGEGLVESSPNRGATVRSFGADEIDEMYQLRAVLEGYAARRAASRIRPEELRRLDDSSERFGRLCEDGEIVDLMRENLVFHTTVLEAARSPRLADVLRSVIEIPLVYRSFFWYSPEQRYASLRSHTQLARALATHDEERSELIMKEHVFEARDHLVQYVRALEEAASATAANGD
jgi:DNA-binding GntR family transcriptional regulator